MKRVYRLTVRDIMRLRAFCKVTGNDFNELRQKPKLAKGYLNKIKWTKVS